MDYQGFCEQFNIAKLNPQQETAVKKVSGATLLLATPGSGKTTVIVARTGYLVYVAGIPARNILNLTYTKAAAKEMQERFIKKFQTTPYNTPKFSTINSFCVSVINTCTREKGVPVPRLITSNERIVRDLARELMPEYPTDNTVKSIAQHITKVKNEMTPLDRIEDISDVNVNFRAFFEAYQNVLRREGLMDFDDQLVMAYQLLLQYPDIRERANRTYQYVSLDEAQDTSLIQHNIVQLLVGRQGNIFMVGDEDQSIYGFRGAYPTALLDFAQNYDRAEVLYMETNYRSDKAIVNAANMFIKRNKLRNNKNMVSHSQESGQITVIKGLNMDQEYELVRDRIGEYLNRPKETLAILSKNNETQLPLLTWINEIGLPVNYRDASGPFFGNFLVMDMLNILAFANNPTDGKLFENLYYKLNLYASRQMYDNAMALSASPTTTCNETPEFLELMKAVAEKPGQIKAIELLRKTLNRITKVSPIIAVGMAMNDTGYKDRWVEKKMDEGTSEQSMMMKFNILRLIAERTQTYEEFLLRMETLRNSSTEVGSNITLSTIHSSKGLEFDHVIILDAIQGILPSGDVMLSENEVEEEARMFYVGATRARHRLELVAPNNFNGFKLNPSYFVKFYETLDGNGMPKEPAGEKISEEAQRRVREAAISTARRVNLSKIHAGSKINHKTYGKGLVKDVSAAGILEIIFESGQTKRFLKSACEENGVITVEDEEN